MILSAIFIPSSLNETSSDEEVAELEHKIAGIDGIREEIVSERKT